MNYLYLALVSCLFCSSLQATNDQDISKEMLTKQHIKFPQKEKKKHKSAPMEKGRIDGFTRLTLNPGKKKDKRHYEIMDSIVP